MTLGGLFGLVWVAGAGAFVFALILASLSGVHFQGPRDAVSKSAGCLVAAASAWITVYSLAFIAPAIPDSLNYVLFSLGTVACIASAFVGARLAPGAWPSIVAALIVAGAITAALLGDYTSYAIEWQGRTLRDYGSDDMPGATYMLLGIILWAPFGLFIGLVTGMAAARTRPMRNPPGRGAAPV